MIMRALNGAPKRIKLGLFDGWQSHFLNIPLRHGSCTRLGTLSSTRLGTLCSSNAYKVMEFISGVYEFTGSCCTKRSEENARLILLQQIAEDGIPQLEEVVVSYRTMFNIAQAFSRCFSAINSRSFN